MMDTQKLLKGKIPGPETGIEVRKSICGLCDPLTQCGLDVYVKDGKVIKVEGSDENPYNGGTLCSKGAATRQWVNHEDRLKTPLKRVGPKGSGKFEPISWDEAMQTIADKLNTYKREYGPESVVFHAGYTKYFRPYLKRLAHSFGTPNYGTESSVCFMAMAMAMKLVMGLPGLPDPMRAHCLLIWSANPAYTNPGAAKGIAIGKEHGLKLIVVDPRVTPTASMADIHLQLRPGTDGALALAMTNVIINEKLYDQDFVANFTYGFEEYKEYVQQFTPEKGEELTGVPADKIRAAARMYASVKPACIIPSASPVVHHTNGVQNYRAVFALAGLTGNYDVHGGNFVMPPSFIHMSGLFPTREHEFAQSIPWEELPTRMAADDFPVWTELLDEDVQTIFMADQIRSGKPYPIKAVVGFGLNYRMWPDSEGFLDGLDKLDFFVNTELFLTDTSKYADIVLPVCSSIERSELRCWPGYVILTQPAIPPLYDSRSDVDVIYELATRLGLDDPLFKSGYEASIDWILEPSGMTVADLKKHPAGMPVPNPIDYPEKKYTLMGGFMTPSKKFEFKSKVLEKYEGKPGYEALPVYTAPKQSKEATPELAQEYPFILNTGSRLPMFVHTRTFRLSWTNSLRPNPAADINPEDAARLGIKQDDNIRLSTPKGSISVKANLTQMGLPGVIHMYHGYPEADVNTLFESHYVDLLSGFPGFKSALCKIEKGA